MPDDKLQEQREFYHDRANEIRVEVLAAYKAIAENISASHFAPVKEMIDEATGKDLEIENAVKIFKTRLADKIEQKVQNYWETIDMEEAISELEYCKANMVTEDVKAWRPTGKSVEEQLCPTVIKALTRRRNYLNRYVEFQNNTIAELIPRVESYRQQLKDQADKRQHLIKQMKADKERVKEQGEQLDETQQKLCQ